MDLPIYKYSPETFFGGEALPVARAIRRNDTTTLTQLLQQRRVDTNYVGKEGMTFLLWAYEHQFIDCLRILVKHGADLNRTMRMQSAKTGNFYNTHLTNIAAVGPSDTVLVALLSMGMNPNMKKQDHESALMTTVYADRYDRLRLLVEHGADVNPADEADSPLIIHVANLNQFDQVI